MKIEKPNPLTLIIIQPRIKTAAFLVFLVVFFGFWYYHILQIVANIGGTPTLTNIVATISSRPILLLFILGPCFFLPSIYQMLKVVTFGERISFDGTMGTISKNHKQLARFDEVNYLQIRTTGGENHRLTAVLKSGKKIKIWQGISSDEIIALAGDLEVIVKVEIIGSPSCNYSNYNGWMGQIKKLWNNHEKHN